MITIDLSGPQGNAFALMAQAKTFARQLGLDDKVILDEMKSGNYDNLLNVFNKYFGEYVTLER